MEVDDVIVVSGVVRISEAFERVVQSRRSVLLVHAGDETHLYSAEALHDGTRANPDAPVAELERIAGAPDLLSDDVKLLEVSSGRAHLRVGSQSLFDMMNFTVGIHKCSGNPIHPYYDWQLKNLKKNQAGKYLCSVDSTIVN